MSITEIEAELERLTPDELRSLALRSWNAFVRSEGDSGTFNECDEDDPALLSALDEGIRHADSFPTGGFTGEEVRERISEWTSK